MAWYGAYDGPSDNALFRVCVDFKVTERGDRQYRASARYWMEATGNFYGTLFHSNFGGDGQVYGAGTYYDTGWVDWGWHDWGSALQADPSAWYTGGSGTEYSSACHVTWTPDTPVWAPYAPTGASHVRSSDTKNVVSWKNDTRPARPYTGVRVQRSTDGGDWAQVASLGAAATSYTDTSTSAGHSYSYRVVARNASGSAASAASAKTLNTPSAPTGVKASRVSDNRNDVAWAGVCPDPALYASQVLQRSVDGGAWADIATLEGSARSHVDRSTSAGHSYSYRVVARNASGSAASAASAKTLNTPSAPSRASHIRNSDAQNTVTWAVNRDDAAVYASQSVQRSTDGGDWEDVKSGLSGSTTSWVDAGTSAGHSYRYRVGARNAAGAAWSAATAETYNTPTAPSVSTERVGGTQVRVTIGSVSRTATAVEVQRKRQGGAWEAVGTYGTSQSEVTDEPGAGTWRYRARATRGELASAWAEESAWVTPMSAPNAPSISSPASGAVMASGTQAELRWSHSPTDGTSQSAWEAQASYDGGATWAGLASGTSETGCPVALDGERDVLLRVRTRGLHPDWSPWAQVSFYSRIAPQVGVLVDPVVKACPFSVSWSCGSMSGGVQRAVVEVSPKGGAAALTMTLGQGAASCEVRADQLVPRDGEAYAVRVSVTSTYGLTGEGTAQFAVAYDAPGVPSVSVSVDRERGAVSLVVGATAGGVPTESLSVWRDGHCLGAGLPGGCEVTDPLPPLDRPVPYEVVAHASSGATSRMPVEVEVESRSFMFLNFGAGWSGVCKAARNLRPDRQTRREYESMSVFGQARPATMYGEHVGATGSLTADVDWIGDLDGAGGPALLPAWVEAEEHAGDYALRMPGGGDAVRVRADISHERGEVYGVATVSVDFEEVCGGLD